MLTVSLLEYWPLIKLILIILTSILLMPFLYLLHGNDDKVRPISNEEMQIRLYPNRGFGYNSDGSIYTGPSSEDPNTEF